MNELDVMEILLIFSPLIILQVALQVYSLVHLWFKSEYSNKNMYSVIIILLGFIGAGIYWFFPPNTTEVKNKNTKDTSIKGEF